MKPLSPIPIITNSQWIYNLERLKNENKGAKMYRDRLPKDGNYYPCFHVTKGNGIAAWNYQMSWGIFSSGFENCSIYNEDIIRWQDSKGNWHWPEAEKKSVWRVCYNDYRVHFDSREESLNYIKHNPSPLEEAIITKVQ